MLNRADCLAIVSRPGKFQGERPYVPYFWDIFLDGGADSNDGFHLVFNVTAEDRAMFPELRRRRAVVLIETNDGFVCEIR